MAAPKGYRAAIPLHSDRSILGVEPSAAGLKNGQGVFWFDPNPAAPTINFKAKDSTGAIRVGQITLT